MSLLANLPHTVEIQALTSAVGPMIGDDDDYPTKQAGVSAWVQTASQAEIDLFERRGFRVTHKIYFATEPATVESDQIIHDGKTYEFRSFADASAGLSVLFKAMFEQVSQKQ